jgi:uncharacterized protein YbaR (Trm112 family)
MSIAPDLLELLRCPVTGQRLAFAPAELLAQLETQRRAGTLDLHPAQPQWTPGDPLEAVLVREDGQIGYLVQGGIPILLPDHGFHLHSPPV